MDSFLYDEAVEELTAETIARIKEELGRDALTVRGLTFGAMPIVIVEPDFGRAEVEAADLALQAITTDGVSTEADIACLLERSAKRLTCALIVYIQRAAREEPDLKILFTVEQDTPTTEYWLTAVAEAGCVAVRVGATLGVFAVRRDALVIALDDWRAVK